MVMAITLPKSKALSKILQKVPQQCVVYNMHIYYDHIYTTTEVRENCYHGDGYHITKVTKALSKILQKVPQQCVVCTCIFTTIIYTP